jgi:hypothetical protein
MLLMLCAAGASSMACKEPRERIGVELSDDGSILVHYKHCRASTLIRQVTLKDLNNTRTDISDDQVLWEIQSEQGSTITEFTVGSTPAGFDRSEELVRPIDELLLNVQVSSSLLPGGESMTFRIDQLRPRQVLAGDGYMSIEEFRQTPACD